MKTFKGQKTMQIRKMKYKVVVDRVKQQNYQSRVVVDAL